MLIRGLKGVRNVATRGFASKSRVLVVGSGRMGKIRASLVSSNPQLELVGIVDLAFKNAQALADQYNTVAYDNLSVAIRESRHQAPLDGLVVSSPTFSHAAVIQEAADNKLSVMTEKPVDETAEKIESLFSYTDAAGVALCCSFQRRFDPSYVSCLNAVQSGRIGRPVMANIFFADHPVPPKEFLLTGGNIFMDLSAHDVDYITNVLQDKVVSVFATGTSSDPELEAAGVHDNATMLLKMSKGTTVTLFMSRSAVYGYDQRCEIFGTSGHVKVSNVHEDTTVLSDALGIHKARLQHSFPERFRTAFCNELVLFADVLLHGQTWPVTSAQCIHVQKVADAARISAETGTVVPVQ